WPQEMREDIDPRPSNPQVRDPARTRARKGIMVRRKNENNRKDDGQSKRRSNPKAGLQSDRQADRTSRANANGRREAVDYGPLADWVGFNLRMAQGAAFQAFARLANEIGTRPGRFATLMLIGRNPGISQTALSRANGRDKSSLTPVLNDLARRGLVIR